MIRLAAFEDIPTLMAIQEAAFSRMAESLLSTVSVDELTTGVAEGLTAVIVEDGGIAGFRMLARPADDYLGQALNDLRRVIYYDITVVHPAYRGRGYQQQLGAWLRREIIVPGRYDWVLSTVHPDNTASMKDKFRLGMHIGYLGLMYGGKTRYIFIDELTDIDWAGDDVAVSREDLERVSQLLGRGYYGKELTGDTLIFDRYL